ncbi:MAG: histone deacetylase family protein [Hyphomicrobiaceae bacterium]
MSTLLLTHSSFVNHDTGYGHPERADRMRALDKVFSHDTFGPLIRADAPMRDDLEAAVVRAHPQEYFDAVVAAKPKPDGQTVRLDGDTVLSPGSWEPVCRAVGAGLEAVDQVMAKDNGIKNVFCQVRPPGHHAERVKAMGFCIFNSIAIAAMYARATYGLDRVAVVDFDVHHGNGTQNIFWSDKDLFFGSTHQMPLYPGSGAVNETGVGNICNAPLRPNDDGGPFREAFESRILKHLDAFQPDFLLISAGFDAHEADPLANLRLVEVDFHWATEQLLERAAKYCSGRVVSMLEGGYDLGGLAGSAAAHVKALMDA